MIYFIRIDIIEKVRRTLLAFYALCAIYLVALFSNLMYEIYKINQKQKLEMNGYPFELDR